MTVLMAWVVLVKTCKCIRRWMEACKAMGYGGLYKPFNWY